MIDTSGILTALECTKFVFGRGGGPQTLLRELTALPRPSSWFKGIYFYGEGREDEREGKAREEDGPLFRKFMDPPFLYCVVVVTNS